MPTTETAAERSSTSPAPEAPVVVVTGAARGLGREIALTLAARGARIVCIDRLDLSETVDALPTHGAALQADVTDAESVDRAFDTVRRRFGRVDVLVNNAGVALGLERKPITEMDVAEWDFAMAVNVRSVFLCTRAAVGMMRTAGQGRIVNVSSDVVASAVPAWLHYVTSKTAVVGMTRALARELGEHGIAVNAVAPGLVTTDVTATQLPAASFQELAQRRCIVDEIVPSDIAEAVAFLAGDGARMVTGHVLVVNGGSTVCPV